MGFLFVGRWISGQLIACQYPFCKHWSTCIRFSSYLPLNWCMVHNGCSGMNDRFPHTALSFNVLYAEHVSVHILFRGKKVLSWMQIHSLGRMFILSCALYTLHAKSNKLERTFRFGKQLLKASIGCFIMNNFISMRKSWITLMWCSQCHSMACHATYNAFQLLWPGKSPHPHPRKAKVKKMLKPI